MKKWSFDIRGGGYRWLAFTTSALYFHLFLSLLLFPDSFCRDLGLVPSVTVNILARRASMLMLAFSILVFWSTRVMNRSTRTLIAWVVSINMSGFALLGIFEYSRATVNSSILFAVAVELTITVLMSFFAISSSNGK